MSSVKKLGSYNDMLILFVITFLGLSGYVILMFNRLVKQRNMMREGWSGIDVQLKRRRDLVPNLVEMVKGYASHESKTLEDVVLARTQSEAAHEVSSANIAEQNLTASMQRLFALVEHYPELRADSNFRKLHDQLVEIEDQIQYARRYYNGAVRDYNILVESFPSNIVAVIFHHSRGDFFEIGVISERENPTVQLHVQ